MAGSAAVTAAKCWAGAAAVNAAGCWAGAAVLNAADVEPGSMTGAPAEVAAFAALTSANQRAILLGSDRAAATVTTAPGPRVPCTSLGDGGGCRAMGDGVVEAGAMADDGNGGRKAAHAIARRDVHCVCSTHQCGPDHENSRIWSSHGGRRDDGAMT